MDKQKIAEAVFAVAVLVFGVLIALNFAYIDENNGATYTSAMFSKRQAVTPMLRIVAEVKEGTYSKSDVSYPQFVRGPLDLNNAIEGAVLGAVADEERTATESWSAKMNALGNAASAQGTPSSAEKLLLRIRWEPAEIGLDRISVLLRIHGATGGVHDLDEVKTFNYDLRGHRLLAIADMFPGDPNYLDQLSGFSYDSLKQQLSGAFNAKLSDAALRWLKAGTSPDPRNFKEFTVDNGRITLYFSQYQVAAYEQGTLEVVYVMPGQ